MAIDFGLPTGGVLFLGDDDSVSVPIRPEQGRWTSWLAVDHAHGDDFVWIESDLDLDYVNPTIVTSPYARTPAGVVRRKVARFVENPPIGGRDMVVNAGMALNLLSRDALRLTRLSDGLGWIIKPDREDAAVVPLWVDDDEVIFLTMDASIPVGFVPSGITRLRRDALGPPTEGTGL